MFKVIVISLVCLFVGLFVFQQIDPNISSPSDGISMVEEEEGKVSITIEGEVVIPGIYKVEIDAILQDVVTSAGGLLESADQNAINLSAAVSSQDYFYIPSISAYANDCILETPVEKVNINTATVEQLSTLTYISTSLGEKIVAYREENGLFDTIEEVMEVSGIGRATYEKIRDYITLK